MSKPSLKPSKSDSKDKLLKSTTSKSKEPAKSKKKDDEKKLKKSTTSKDKAKKNKEEPVKIIQKNKDKKKPKKATDSEMQMEELMSQFDQDGMEMLGGEIEDVQQDDEMAS